MADIPRSAAANPHPRVGLLTPAKRLGRALRFASQGVAYAWRAQPNLRVEAAIGFAAVLLAAWLGTGLVPVILATALVISLELVNTAIERIVDLVSPDYHPLAGAAKDSAAAAVLVASAGALLVGLLALGPALLQRLGLL